MFLCIFTGTHITRFNPTPITEMPCFCLNGEPNQLGQASSSEKRQILPKAVTPSHYKVNITPNLSTFKFDGIVEIR